MAKQKHKAKSPSTAKSAAKSAPKAGPTSKSKIVSKSKIAAKVKASAKTKAPAKSKIAPKAKRSVKVEKLDPVVMTVIANRLDGIVREMTNTLLRAARSAVISSARDFSCCILTGDNQLLASAEGLPVHIFGAHLQGANMARYHEGDIREGDAYLDNDPYGGNTHPADHTFLVPVFIDGEHLFTTVAKCHMAD